MKHKEIAIWSGREETAEYSVRILISRIGNVGLPSFQTSKLAYNLALKTRAMEIIGNGKAACVKCGFDDLRALQADHIESDGYLKREGTGRQLNWWITKNPEEAKKRLQTLCANCNRIKQKEKGEYRRPSTYTSYYYSREDND